MSLSRTLVLRGLLAVAVGIVSVAWPNITVGAFVVLFAVYAFIAAAGDVSRAFAGDRAGPVIGWLLLSLLSLAAGVVALVWPGITALVLTLWIASWAVVTGVVEVGLAFLRGEAAGQRAMWALSGLVLVALGVVLFIRPDIGALSLAMVFGLFSIVYGITEVVLGAQARRVRTTAERVLPTPGQQTGSVAAARP